MCVCVSTDLFFFISLLAISRMKTMKRKPVTAARPTSQGWRALVLVKAALASDRQTDRQRERQKIGRAHV